MTFDLGVLKSVGINMLRKHIKVEPALYYKACDEMGLLVIQDMPSLRPDLPDRTDACRSIRLEGQAEQDEFNRELGLMVEQLRSYPSIFAWTIYNEEWGQNTSFPFVEFGLEEKVRSLDPTRLVNAVSGWTDHRAGDFDDNHHYSTPQCGTPFWSRQGDGPDGSDSAYDPNRIALQGEFGGVGQYPPNGSYVPTFPIHLSNINEPALTRDRSWYDVTDLQVSYELVNATKDWNYRTHTLLSELREQTELFACSGGVWTQTTDVEGEVNGLMTYDRKVIRMDIEQWKKDVAALYETAAARAKNGTTQFGVMSGRSEGNAQFGMP